MSTVDTSAHCGANPLPALMALRQLSQASQEELSRIIIDLMPLVVRLEDVLVCYGKVKQPLEALEEAAIDELVALTPASPDGSHGAEVHDAAILLARGAANDIVWEHLNGLAEHLDDWVNGRIGVDQDGTYEIDDEPIREEGNRPDDAAGS